MMDRLKKYIVHNQVIVYAYFLAVAVSMTVYDLYGIKLLSLWTAGVMAVCAITFVFSNYCNSHRDKATLYVILLVLADILLFKTIAFGGDKKPLEFLQWLFLEGEINSYNIRFLLALLVILPPFLSFVIFYFSNVMYRMMYLTLVSVIPVALYVKVVAEIDNFYLVLIAIFNLLICIGNRYKNNGVCVVGINGMLIAISTFVFSVLVIASLIPKESEARYYSKYRSLISNSNINLNLGSAYTDMNQVSGNADNFEGFSDRIMYTVYGSTVPYLKRQNFDYYDYNNDYWYADSSCERLSYTAEEWTYKNFMLNLTALQNAINNAEIYSPGFASKYGLDKLVNADKIDDRMSNIYIQANNFSAVYFLVPERCTGLAVRGENPTVYVTPGGTFRNEGGQRHLPYTAYQVTAYNNVSNRYLWYTLGGANFDNGQALVMLYELREILLNNNDSFAYVADLFYQSQTFANNYKYKCQENTAMVSEEVKQLALEITKDCTYDWEKAEALQSYFTENGFVYDLEYTAEDTSPEYFLFESKRGTCSDFASAFVLMARAAGLTVRYAEGYSPKEAPGENMYTIYDSDAHAYPEVFIQNMGWLVYEPTVASMYNNFNNGGLWGFINSLEPDFRLALIIGVMAIVCVLAWVFYLVFVPLIGEGIFINKLKKAEAKACITLIYGRISGKVLIKLIPEAKSMTPYELASKVLSLTDFNMLSFAYNIEEIVYGNKEANNINKEELINLYKSLKQTVKKYNRHKK